MMTRIMFGLFRLWLGNVFFRLSYWLSPGPLNMAIHSQAAEMACHLLAANGIQAQVMTEEQFRALLQQQENDLPHTVH